MGLAQALVHDPKVLLLDEPTNGLDPEQTESMRGLIKSLANERTILLSSHLLHEVELVCSDTIILSEGRVLAQESLLNRESGDLRRRYLQLTQRQFNSAHAKSGSSEQDEEASCIAC